MREIKELISSRLVVTVLTDSEESALKIIEELSKRRPIALIDERRVLFDLIRSERAVLVRKPEISLLEELSREGFVVVCAFSNRRVDPLKLSARVRPLLFLDWPSEKGLTRISAATFTL